MALKPQMGAVAPLEARELVGLFGTDRPTREDIERNRGALLQMMQARGRWSGSYVVVYGNGAPSEILFFGQSGD